MNEIERIKTSSLSISCKGNEYPYDHPIIYLEIDSEVGFIECPYCAKYFEFVGKK